MNRRQVVGLLAAAPFAATVDWATAGEVHRRVRAARAAGPYEPKVFTPHEWETVRVLVDLIIPKDDRSGGATDAGVPEFMDFMLGDDPDLETPVRGGLAWLDHECEGVAFFNRFRDLTASGFFSSKMGVQDLRYIGNTFVSEWKGCPPDALAKLGVNHD